MQKHRDSLALPAASRSHPVLETEPDPVCTARECGLTAMTTRGSPERQTICKKYYHQTFLPGDLSDNQSEHTESIDRSRTVGSTIDPISVARSRCNFMHIIVTSTAIFIK